MTSGSYCLSLTDRKRTTLSSHPLTGPHVCVYIYIPIPTSFHFAVDRCPLLWKANSHAFTEAREPSLRSSTSVTVPPFPQHHIISAESPFMPCCAL